MADSVWLLDLVAGQTWRFASRRIVFDGNEYTDGFETSGSFLDGLSFVEPTESAMPITVWAQGVPDFDAEDVALGATATVYFWRDPDGSDDPIVVVSGTVEDPVYGGADEPLTASVTEVPWDDRGRIPETTARITDDTWPARDPLQEIEGEFYTTVIGEPGVIGGGVLPLPSDSVFGSPAYYVLFGPTDLIQVAGHPVRATSITIDDVTGGSARSLAVTIKPDGLGRNVAVANATAWGVPALTLGSELWATWDGGGGLENPERPGELLTGAGDLIEYLLHRSSIRVDWGRLRAAKARLNAYRIDTYIQSPPESRVVPWDWITAHLLPILPVAVRTGPAGLYLAVFDPATPGSQVRAKLETGRNCTRISPVSVEGTSDAVNDFTLTYAPFADKDKGSATVRVTGSTAVLAAHSGAIRSAICEESVRRFKRDNFDGVISREFQTTAVYQEATAVRILTSMASRMALPPKQVTFALDDLPELNQLEPGDSIALTDVDEAGRPEKSTLGWTDRVGYVWTVNVEEAREITLRFWHQPGRDFAQQV